MHTYDVVIGGGQATTHPLFYAYLCAVADWRLKGSPPGEDLRPGILSWADLKENFMICWKDELTWHSDLISASVAYYSTGVLPASLPLPPEGLRYKIVLQTFNKAENDMKEPKR